VALNINKAVYPRELVPKLTEMDYQIDVDSRKAHKSMDLFLRDLDKTLKARIKVYGYLWHNQKWDTFMLVFTGTDRLFHFLWNAYEDPSHTYHEAVLDHFRQIDNIIGEIRETMDEQDNLILLSDHGFEGLETEVNINFYLKQHGLLTLKDGKEENLSNIDRPTKAFALDPTRIYVNLAGKYPEGSVNQKDKERLIQELIPLFESLEIDGRKVIKRIFRAREIYRGPYLNQAPDLVLLSNKGLNLKASIKAKKVVEKGIFTGKHSQQDAFLVVKGKENDGLVQQMPKVEDIVTIIHSLEEKGA
jgi:predicted AlkP superfamily phosphohydrolase/phosphomutase